MRLAGKSTGALRIGAVLALAIQIAAAGGVMSALAKEPEPRGRMVTIAGGRRMRIVCDGPAAGARPTVLLEAGSWGFSADWAAVQTGLAAAGLRSCAYDRAGLGHSDPGPSPRDSRAIAADLAALLAAAGESGPFILCGHSMAGLHLRVFAAQNAQRVVGLVLVDAPTPETTDQPAARRFIGQFGRVSRLAAALTRTGLPRPFAGAFGDLIGLPPDARAEKRWAFGDARHARWAAAEAGEWARDAEEGRQAGPYDPAWPVAVVLTGGRLDRAGESGELRSSQEAPALASRHGSIERVPGANHASLLGLRFAAHIVGAILKVEAAASASA